MATVGGMVAGGGRGDELEIISVEETGPGTAVCLVRCLAGVARVGGRFETGTPVLDRMDRAEHVPVDFIDPPHTAKARFSGEGVRALRPRIVMSSTGPRRYVY